RVPHRCAMGNETNSLREFKNPLRVFLEKRCALFMEFTLRVNSDFRCAPILGAGSAALHRPGRALRSRPTGCAGQQQEGAG
ncbi:hypothetical protein ACFW5V_37925, partial [Streptomyces sp. NPDC058762]|uniref:hypothetical protein n=1 Tax=Streptomyces sp. NPDC058762 TaxID=3346629 RepID=UPI00368BA52A